MIRTIKNLSANIFGATIANGDGKGAMVVVYGESTVGTNTFSDLVFYCNGYAVALASRDIAGTPSARTYTASGNDLVLALANVYEVTTSEFKGD
jgi:hypothetical protein